MSTNDSLVWPTAPPTALSPRAQRVLRLRQGLLWMACRVAYPIVLVEWIASFVLVSTVVHTATPFFAALTFVVGLLLTPVLRHWRGKDVF